MLELDRQSFLVILYFAGHLSPARGIFVVEKVWIDGGYLWIQLVRFRPTSWYVSAQPVGTFPPNLYMYIDYYIEYNRAEAGDKIIFDKFCKIE